MRSAARKARENQMATDKRPGHLRPVSRRAPAEATRDASSSATAPTGIPGLTPPLGRGNSAMFLTDVIVELGYATRERVDEVIQEARIAGRSPDELLVEQQADRRRPALARGRRALRPRPRRPQRLPRRHGRGQPALGRRGAPLPGGAGRLRRPEDAAGRDRRPGERARDRRHPDDHRPQLQGRGRRRPTTSRR